MDTSGAELLGNIFLIIVIFTAVYLFYLAMQHSQKLQAIFFVVMGTGIGVIAHHIAYENNALRRSAVTVQATIIDMKITRERRGYRHNIYVTYQFPADSELRTAHDTLSEERYSQTNIGDTITLMVAADDPDVTTLKIYYPPSNTAFYGMIFCCLFFIALGLFSLFF